MRLPIPREHLQQPCKLTIVKRSLCPSSCRTTKVWAEGQENETTAVEVMRKEQTNILFYMVKYSSMDIPSIRVYEEV
jgi:hypothetical protein